MKNEKKCIALIGFMATGKSTIGPLLARELESAAATIEELAAEMEARTNGEPGL